MKALSLVLILMAPFGATPVAAPAASSGEPTILQQHSPANAEGDSNEGATCEDSCDVAEEWCAVGCEELSAGCSAVEEDGADCISSKALCEVACHQELEACQARCDAP